MINSLDNLSRPIMELSDCKTDAEKTCCSLFVAIASQKAEQLQRVLEGG